MKTKFSNSILVTFLLPLAVACNQLSESDLSHDSVVDLGPFGSYVAEFQAKGADNGASVEITDLIMKFGPMTNPLERGYCEMGGNRTPTIVIDQNYWNISDEGARKSLLLHELGHCVLSRAHVSKLTNLGVPESVMNPYTIPGNVFNFNEAHYWQELFSVRNTM
jgi:hypothetical protein